MLTAEMIAALRCPLCRQPLRLSTGALSCAGGHSFDLARQGYAFLGTGKALPAGDTAPMVEARLAFFATGHFTPLLQAVAAHAVRTAGSGSGPGLVADLGAGPGTYLAAVLERLPHAHGLAFDVSKAALKRAARGHPRMGAVLADTWASLPLQDESVDLMLNVFAPRNGAEMRRVLKPGGNLIVVTPRPEHLIELRVELGLLKVDESKPERVAASLSQFAETGSEVVTWPMELSAAEAELIVQMGPNAFHGTASKPTARTVTAAVTVSTWRGRPLPSPAAPHDSGR